MRGFSALPELPEVETTCRGLRPHLIGRSVDQLLIREARLRWPVPPELPALLQGRSVQSLERRGKYLILGFAHGSVLIHLGMSGSLRLTQAHEPLKKHDHIDMLLTSSPDHPRLLRYHDPRRFGAMLWTSDPPPRHPLLADLGPEPLGEEFDGDYLCRLAQSRGVAVKAFIMDSKVVVGVGNIYASEALFRARLHPERTVSGIAPADWQALAEAIQAVLADAIQQGGTTLRDFVDGHGKPGYFQQALHVYGRAGLPCPLCAQPVQCTRLGQRSSYFCARCQC